MAGLISFKQTAAMVFAMLVMSCGSIMNAFASDSPPVKNKTLVALGDSITFGYNLPDTLGNTSPSPSSFPELIGKSDNLAVSNLGVPGWTTADLLHALQTPDFVRAIQGASVITLDIGNNDLIQIAGDAGLFQMALSPTPIQLSDSEQRILEMGATHVGQNLGTIVSMIRSKTDAPILLYNLYNPFPDTSILHDSGEQFEQIINLEAQNIAMSTSHVEYMNAHQAFDHHQSTYVRVADGDIHPTLLGQQILERVGESSLAPILPTLKEKSGVSIEQVSSNIGSQGGSIGAHLWENAISLDVLPNGFNTSTEIDVTSTGLLGLASIVPTNEKIVAEASVHFDSGVEVAKPYILTVRNSAILSGGSVYQIKGNKFEFVPSAKVDQGKAVIPATTEGDFVVVEPMLTSVPNGTKPETGFPALIYGAVALLVGIFGGSLMYVGRNKQQS